MARLSQKVCSISNNHNRGHLVMWSFSVVTRLSQSWTYHAFWAAFLLLILTGSSWPTCVCFFIHCNAHMIEQVYVLVQNFLMSVSSFKYEQNIVFFKSVSNKNGNRWLGSERLCIRTLFLSLRKCAVLHQHSHPVAFPTTKHLLVSFNNQSLWLQIASWTACVLWLLYIQKYLNQPTAIYALKKPYYFFPKPRKIISGSTFSLIMPRRRKTQHGPIFYPCWTVRTFSPFTW